MLSFQETFLKEILLGRNACDDIFSEKEKHDKLEKNKHSGLMYLFDKNIEREFC